MEGKILLKDQATSRAKMAELLGAVDKEFSLLWEENLLLRARLGLGPNDPVLPEMSKQQAMMAPKDSTVKKVFKDTSSVKSERPMSRGGLTESKAALAGAVAGSDRLVGASLSSVSSSSTSTAAKEKGTVKWNLAKVVSGHQDGIWEIVACPDLGAGPQQVFATASVDRSVRLWSAVTGQCLMAYFGHKGSVNSVRVSASDRLIVTASGDKTAQIFRPPWWKVSPPAQSSQQQQGLGDEDDRGGDDFEPPSQPFNTPFVRSPMMELKGHRGVVIAADFLAGGDRVITASWDRTARLWPLHLTAPSAAPLSSLTLSSDNNTQHVSTSVAIQQVETGGTGDRCRPTNISAHPSSPIAVISSSDGAFRIWDMRVQHIVVEVPQAHSDSCLTAVFSPDGEMIVSGGGDKHVRIWDMRSSLKNSRLDIRTGAPPIRFSMAPISHNLLLPQDEGASIIDTNTGKRIGKVAKHPRASMLMANCWSCNEANLYTATFDGVVSVWSKSAVLLAL